MWQSGGMSTTLECSEMKNSLASTSRPGKKWTNNWAPNSSPILLRLTHTAPLTSNFWSAPGWTPSLPVRKRPSTLSRVNGQLAPAHPAPLDQRIGTHLMTRMLQKGGTSSPFAKPRNPSYACNAATPVTVLAIVLPRNPTSPNTPLPVTGSSTSSSPSQTSLSASCTMFVVLAPTQHPTTVITPAPYAAMAAIQHADAPGTDLSHLLYTNITPYNPHAWHLALIQAGLNNSFLNLVHDLTHGSPIGDLPLLTYTFTPKNLSSADIDPAYMDSFLVEEVSSGHMDSPFSMDTAHHIFRGHFCTAPLGFVEKPGSMALCLIWHHSKKDHLGISTNGCIDASSCATKFYSAAHAANFVSTDLLIILTPCPPHMKHTCYSHTCHSSPP